ncbi:hypothetical protein M0805_008302 [Coniferiporia weirii]|nr:hypothetical protein M0805_008302 [Coniferiporia weirii]
MAHISLELLPHDVRDHLLTVLPDQVSLRCAMLASRQLYEAYTLRRRTILSMVVANEVGPALPSALALVRTRDVIYKSEELATIIDGLNSSDSESVYWKGDITPEEAHDLTKVSSVARRLEAHFSNRFKDRTAPLSTLSELEKLRFHRAIYRSWIISVLSSDNDEQDEVQLHFLENLIDEELVEVFETMHFLDAIGRAVRTGSITFHGTRALNVEFDELLCSFDSQGHYRESASTGLGNPAIQVAYDALCEDRNIRQLFEDRFGSRAILARARVEEIQHCQRCEQPSQLLLGENNWHWMQICFDDLILARFLPGHLANNAGVLGQILTMFRRPCSYVAMISTMFDDQNDPESGWTREHWLCLDCLTMFIRERIFSWFVSQLVKDEYVFKTNCWYGWNCRTQVHKPHHADRLNHICEPTGRDDSQRI